MNNMGWTHEQEWILVEQGLRFYDKNNMKMLNFSKKLLDTGYFPGRTVHALNSKFNDLLRTHCKLIPVRILDAEDSRRNKSGATANRKDKDSSKRKSDKQNSRSGKKQKVNTISKTSGSLADYCKTKHIKLDGDRLVSFLQKRFDASSPKFKDLVGKLFFKKITGTENEGNDQGVLSPVLSCPVHRATSVECAELMFRTFTANDINLDNENFKLMLYDFASGAFISGESRSLIEWESVKRIVESHNCNQIGFPKEKALAMQAISRARLFLNEDFTFDTANKHVFEHIGSLIEPSLELTDDELSTEVDVNINKDNRNHDSPHYNLANRAYSDDELDIPNNESTTHGLFTSRNASISIEQDMQPLVSPTIQNVERSPAATISGGLVTRMSLSDASSELMTCLDQIQHVLTHNIRSRDHILEIVATLARPGLVQRGQKETCTLGLYLGRLSDQTDDRIIRNFCLSLLQNWGMMRN